MQNRPQSSISLCSTLYKSKPIYLQMKNKTTRMLNESNKGGLGDFLTTKTMQTIIFVTLFYLTSIISNGGKLFTKSTV